MSSVQEIVETLDITDYISQFVDLIPGSKNGEYMGLCPFHEDKNPSLSVSANKGLWHCFACDIGGDLITFVETLKDVEFLDALKEISDFYHVDFDFKVDEQQAERKEIENILNDINNVLNFSLMNEKKGTKVKDIIKSRGYSEDTINEFGLGYADFGNILKYFRQKKIPIETQLKTKLIGVNKNGEVYQTLRNRITFPIRNIQGHLIGFSGRVLNKEDEERYHSKYKHALSTVEEQAYFFNNKIARGKTIYIVEGFYDVMALEDAGIKNSLSTLGTSITDKQVNELSTKTSDFVVSLDGDEAGMNSANKIIDRFMELDGINEINTNAVIIPNDLDVDDFRKKYGDKKLSILASKPKSRLDFKTYYSIKHGELNNREDISRLAPYLIERYAKDDIEKEIYYQKISKNVDLPINILKSQGRKAYNEYLEELSKEKEKIRKRLENKVSIANQDSEEDSLEDIGFAPETKTNNVKKEVKKVQKNDGVQKVDTNEVLNSEDVKTDNIEKEILSKHSKQQEKSASAKDEETDIFDGLGELEDFDEDEERKQMRKLNSVFESKLAMKEWTYLSYLNKNKEAITVDSEKVIFHDYAKAVFESIKNSSEIDDSKVSVVSFYDKMMQSDIDEQGALRIYNDLLINGQKEYLEEITLDKIEDTDDVEEINDLLNEMRKMR